MIFVLAANALQADKDINQVIPLKLKGMAFTVFTKDNIDRQLNETTNHLYGTSICLIFRLSNQ